MPITGPGNPVCIYTFVPYTTTMIIPINVKCDKDELCYNATIQHK